MSAAAKVEPAQPLKADRALIRHGIETLWKHHLGGDGYLMGLASKNNVPKPKGAPIPNVPPWPRCYALRHDTSRLVTEIGDFADEAAQGQFGRGVAFRHAVFGSMMIDDARFGGANNVIASSIISLDIDHSPTEGRAAAEKFCGTPTLAVYSGGMIDGQRKQQLHFRLSRPAVLETEIADLEYCRSALVALCGGDKNGRGRAAAFRLLGTWHTKGEPVLVQRAEGDDPSAEYDLAELKTRLQSAAESMGILVEVPRAPGSSRPKARPCAGDPSSDSKSQYVCEPVLTAEQLMGCAKHFPNPDVDYKVWDETGGKFYAASGGSEEGLQAFIEWSEKSGKHDEEFCADRWSHWHTYPYEHFNALSIVEEVWKAGSDFLKQELIVDVWFEAIEVSNDNDPDGEGKALEAAHTDGADGAQGSKNDPISSTPWFREMNERHAFVVSGGKAVVANVEPSGIITYSSKTSFFDSYANMEETVGRTKRSRADLWFHHKARRQFLSGVGCHPRGTAPGVFNAWNGLAPLPEPKERHAETKDGCPLILAHIRSVLACGNAEHEAYILKWLAHMLQRPEERPDTAIVLRGRQGSGKDTLGYYLRAVLGVLYRNVSNHKHVTGNFNAHLIGKLMLHAEEAAFAGRKAEEGLLKALITQKELLAEPKGVDAFSVDSFLRVMMTSNEHHVVPAAEGERRFAIFDTSPHRCRDWPYFRAIYNEMEGDGAFYFRRFLEEMDLSGFEVRDLPRTDALREQQASSLRGFDLFWSQLIDDGASFQADDGQAWEDAPVLVEKDAFRGRYHRWAREQRDERPMADALLTKRLAEFLGQPADDLVLRHRVNGARRQSYSLPSAVRCRELWTERFR